MSESYGNVPPNTEAAGDRTPPADPPFTTTGAGPEPEPPHPPRQLTPGRRRGFRGAVESVLDTLDDVGSRLRSEIFKGSGGS